MIHETHYYYYRLERKRAAVLEWLTPMDYRAKQGDTKDRWHPGTCGWIFETNEFEDWISNDLTSLLLCTGIRRSFYSKVQA